MASDSDNVIKSLTSVKSLFWLSLTNEKFSLNVCLFLGFPSVQVKLGSITSCCSGNEPALLPRTRGGETRHERAAELEPKVKSEDGYRCPLITIVRFVSRDQFYPMRAGRNYSVGTNEID